MIEELVSKVFSARNASHLAHWATKSYAEHQALGAFYDDVIDAIDSIVEAYQGRFGLIDVMELENQVGQDIIEVLRENMDWIEDNRQAISGGVTAIENLIDGLSDIYLRTVYKLENLS
jgi:hypothetical protein